MEQVQDPVLIKLKQLMKERHITIYRLTEQTSLSENTIYNWYNKGASPSIPALRAICKVLDISMAELFAEEDEPAYSSKEQRWIGWYRNLTEEQKDVIDSILKVFKF